MRTIMVMFDTLTRKFLPNYGNDWVSAPNFKRLENKCKRFDNFYAASLPCMPARRDLHTAKYNFVFRGWGPLEPFDNSVMEELKANGIYTHLVTDHSHYWEDGGCTYHNRYDTWEGFRGQEGDRYVAHDIMPNMPKDRDELNKKGLSVVQHYRNRTRQKSEEEMSGSRVFAAGLEFLDEHVDKDNWFLQIEAFDPHEPFYVPQKYRKMYGLPEEETLNWPRYGEVDGEHYHEQLDYAAKEYAALLSMCDEHLGKVLDFMDENDMWKDTALIVNTDHGFLLGEHEWLGKNFPPCYDELVHTPFFMHVPKVAEDGSTNQLCSTVDIAPTLLDLFGCSSEGMGEIDGKSLMPVLENNEKIHDEVIFGMHGMYTCITDGEYVFMKANLKEEKDSLYEITMMPTNIRGFFKKEELQKAELVEGGRFTNGLPAMKIPVSLPYDVSDFGDRLYNVNEDEGEVNNLIDETKLKTWSNKLKQALDKIEAPKEEYMRLGL